MKPRYFNRFLVAAVFTMTAAASAAPVTWNVTDGTWDTVTANWLPASPGTFANGDDATFSQAAGGTVTLVGTIAPLSTTVSAAGGTYTFQGGGITGGVLNKSGAGTLVLGNGNTYTGATTISGGTLKVANPVVALPAISGMTVHLDATQIVAANGSNVTSWTNLAAGGAGDFGVTAGTAPTFVSAGNLMNGRPVVRFNNGALLTNATNFGNNVTVMYVGRMSGGQNRRLVAGLSNNWLLGYWAGNMNVHHWANTPSMLTGALDYSSHIFVGTANGTTAWGYNADGNESQFGTGALGTGQGPNGLALGGWGSGGASEQSYGDIGELLVFNRALTAEERLQVENYLQAKWYGALPSKSAINLTASGTTFDVAGAKQTIGSLAGVPGSQTLINGGDLTIGNDNTTTTFSGVVANGTTGGGSLSKTGSGDLILSGDAANTFTGTTTLVSGRIGLAKTGGAYAVSGDFLGSNNTSPEVYTTADNQFAPGSVMRFTGAAGDHIRFELLGTTQTLAGIDNVGTGGRGIIQHREQATTANAVGPISNLILNGSGSYSYDGYLRSNGGILALTKNGTGTQILSGANISYSGGTNLNAGILQFEGTNKAISGGMVLNGGTLNQNGTGYTVVAGVLNVAVNSTINVNTTSANRNLFFDGGISGSGNLTINSTGDSFTGVHFRNGTPGQFSGNLTVNDGHFASQGNGFNFQNSNVTLNNTTWYMDGSQFATTAANEQIGSLNGNGNMAIGALSLTLGTFNKSGSLSGNITGTTGSLTKTGSGTQTLSGTVSYTGNTIVNGGILNLTGTATLGATTVSSGALNLTGTATLGATTVSGGDLNLTGVATLGATTISGGNLSLDYTTNDNSKIADTAVMTLAGGTVNLTGGTHVEWVQSVTLNTGASKIIRTSGDASLDMGQITRNAGATINFSEDNIAKVLNSLTDGILGTWATVGSGASTRFATTDIDGFVIGSIGTATTTVNDFVDAAVNYEYSLSSGTDVQTDHRIANTVRYSGSGETIDLDTFDLSIKSLLNVGTGTLTLSRSGVTGSLVANDLFLNGINSGIVVSAPITGSNLSNSGNITLSGANTYTGSTTISGGTLLAGSPTALGDATTVTLNGGTLDINGQPLVLGSLAGNSASSITNTGADALLTLGNTTSTNYAGIIGDGVGAISLTKVDSGVLTLSGNNTYTGTTTISAGTLQIGNGGTTGTLASGNVANNGTLKFHRAGNLTVASTITGTGNIQLLNSASGNITFSGAITCNNLNFDRAGSTAAIITLSGSSPNAINSLTASQDGHGTLVLAKDAGVNALSGTVSVAVGGPIGNGYASQVRVMLANNEQIADDAIVRMGGSGGGHGGRAWFDLMGYSETIAGLTDGTSQSYVRNMAATPSTLTLAGSGTYTLVGSLQNGAAGTLGITKSGSGTQTFAGGGISYTGATIINDGRLILRDTGGVYDSASTTIASGKVLEFNVTGTNTAFLNNNNQTFAGAGRIEKTGTGMLAIGGQDQNVFMNLGSGALIDIKEGTVRNEWFAGKWADNRADMNIATGAKFDVWDADTTVDALTGGGNMNKGFSGTHTLTIGVDNGSGVFSGTITNTSGSLKVTKTGSGIQTLSSANTYSGNTAVDAGSLIVSGTLGATAVTVASGATLDAGNNIAGNAALGSNLNVLSGGHLAFHIAPTASAQVTRTLTGTLSLTNGNLVDLSADAAPADGVYTLATASTGITGTPGTGSTLNFAGKNATLSVSGNSLILTVTSTGGFNAWINSFTFPEGADKTPAGDPDNDGITNGAEMVLGGNPAIGMDTALLPTIEMVTDPVGVPAIPAGSYMLFTYRRTDLSVSGGVLANCETDADLIAPWTTVTGAAPTVIQVDDNYPWTNPSATNTDRVRVYVPSGPSSKLFGRLNVNVP